MCKRQFVGGSRLNPALIWEAYFHGKQTYQQLSSTYHCSAKTIQRKLDLYRPVKPEIGPREVVILMDTVYWGRDFGVTLFRDALSKQNLLKRYVNYETNRVYREGINELIDRGFTIKAIVCDGRRGLLNSFKNIPVQMCHFHQVAIVRRYITKRPKMPASIELQELVNMLKCTDKESFEGGLSQWFCKWEGFLNERSINPITGKSTFTHRRLRSAYRSLKTNLNWLFTWYDYFDLNIPTTTNALEGHFADLKNKMRNHNGLSKARKRKFIDEFFKA